MHECPIYPIVTLAYTHTHTQADSHFGQGLSFFAADRMWLQPGGWVHQMFHDAWLPLTAAVALSGTPPPLAQCGLMGDNCQPKWMDGTSASRPSYCCKPSVSAAFSEDRTQVSLRFVNPSNTTEILLTVDLPPGTTSEYRDIKNDKFAKFSEIIPNSGSPREATDGCWKLRSVSQLSHEDLHAANTWNDTSHVSPTLAELSGKLSFVAPPQSVSVARLSCESTQI